MLTFPSLAFQAACLGELLILLVPKLQEPHVGLRRWAVRQC